MPYVGKDFSDMGPTERRLRGFKFDQSYGDGELVESAAFLLIVDGESAVADATPADRLDGDAQIEDQVARIWVKEPLEGVSYILQCTAISTQGRKITLWSRFVVRER